MEQYITTGLVPSIVPSKWEACLLHRNMFLADYFFSTILARALVTANTTLVCHMGTLTSLSSSTSSPHVSAGCTGCRSHGDACVELSPPQGVYSLGPHMCDEKSEYRGC